MKENKPITIFGGTGHYGQRIAKSLLKKDIPVRILTRNPDKARELLGDSVELVFGDVLSKECIINTLKDASAVIICLSAFTPKLIRQLHAIEQQAVLKIIDEMVKQRIDRLVFLSVYDIREDLLDRLSVRKLAEVKIASEKYIKSSNLNWTILGCPPSYELFFALLQGKNMVVPGGGKNKIACVSPDDVGQICAQAVLMDDLKGQRIRMAGPEALSFPEVIQRISGYTGQKIRHISPPLFIINLVSFLVKPFNPFLRYIYYSLKMMNNFPEDLVTKNSEDHKRLLRTFNYLPINFNKEIENRYLALHDEIR